MLWNHPKMWFFYFSYSYETQAISTNMIGRYYSTYAGISISFFRENSSPMHFPHNPPKKPPDDYPNLLLFDLGASCIENHLNIKNWGGVSSRVAYSRSCTSHFWLAQRSLSTSRVKPICILLIAFISLLFSTFKVFSESTLSADDYWYTTQGSCWSANPNYKYGGSCKRQARSQAQQQRYRKEKLTVIGSRRLSMRSQRLWFDTIKTTHERPNTTTAQGLFQMSDRSRLKRVRENKMSNC